MQKDIRYPNGLRVVAYQLDSSFSTNIGIFVKAGTSSERSENYGCAHFLEHMLFKGTAKRTALDIAEAIDGIGGIINAYTTHEYTAFYTRSLIEDAPLALDVLFDMLTASSLDAVEIEKEKKVILEEINMYEDDPGSLVVEEFSKRLFKGSPLGTTILGDKKLLPKMTREILVRYYKEHYRPDKMILVVTGNFGEGLLRTIGETFGSLTPEDAPEGREEKADRARPFGIRIIEKPSLNQIYFAAGYEGFGKTNPDYNKLNLLNNILGASTSSYLFQELREKHSLCYDIGSFTSAFRSTGEFVINGGANTENFPLALAETRRILEELRRNGAGREEFDRAKKQMKSQLVMSFENPQNIMFKIASDCIYFGEYKGIDYAIAATEEIGYEEFNRFIADYLDLSSLSICLLGPKGSKSIKAIWEGYHEEA